MARLPLVLVLLLALATGAGPAVTQAAQAAHLAHLAQPAQPADPAATRAGDQESLRLRAAVRALPVARETPRGYDRDRFEHWVDADHDCHTSGVNGDTCRRRRWAIHPGAYRHGHTHEDALANAHPVADAPGHRDARSSVAADPARCEPARMARWRPPARAGPRLSRLDHPRGLRL